MTSNNNTNERENNMNVRTEAAEKRESISEFQTRMLEHTKRELWELWNKTNSQIARDCILTGIVEVSRKIEEIAKNLD